MSEKTKTYNQTEVDSLVKQKISDAINAYRQEVFDEIYRSLNNTNNSKCNSSDWLIRSVNLAIKKDKSSIPASMLKNDRIVKILDLISQDKNTAEKSTDAQAPLIDLSELYKDVKILKNNVNIIIDKLDLSNCQYAYFNSNIQPLSTEFNGDSFQNKTPKTQQLINNNSPVIQQNLLSSLQNPFMQLYNTFGSCDPKTLYSQIHSSIAADNLNKGFELADSIVFERTELDVEIDRLKEYIRKYHIPQNNKEAINLINEQITTLESIKYIPADNCPEDTSILVGTLTIQQFKLKFFNVLEVESKSRYGKITVDIKLGNLTVSVPSILSYKIKYEFNEKTVKELVNELQYYYINTCFCLTLVDRCTDIFRLSVNSELKYNVSMAIRDSIAPEDKYYGIILSYDNTNHMPFNIYPHFQFGKINNSYQIVEDLSNKVKYNVDKNLITE